MNTPDPSQHELEAQLAEPAESSPPRRDQLRAEIMRQIRNEQASGSGKTRQPLRPAVFTAIVAAAACLAIAFIPAFNRTTTVPELTVVSEPEPEWRAVESSFSSQAESILTSPYRKQYARLGDDLAGLGRFLSDRFDFVESLQPAEDGGSNTDSSRV